MKPIPPKCFRSTVTTVSQWDILIHFYLLEHLFSTFSFFFISYFLDYKLLKSLSCKKCIIKTYINLYLYILLLEEIYLTKYENKNKN